jgi:hypothetical protein
MCSVQRDRFYKRTKGPFAWNFQPDFRSGRRHTADPRKPNTNTMIELAKSLSDDELKAASL